MINWLKGYYDKETAQIFLCLLALIMFIGEAAL